MSKQTKITADTTVYLIENEEGAMRYTLTPPDYLHTRAMQKMTLAGFAESAKCPTPTMRACFVPLLCEIAALTSRKLKVTSTR